LLTNKAEYLDKAKSNILAAEKVYTQDKFPKRWIAVRLNLGTIYHHRYQVDPKLTNLKIAARIQEVALAKAYGLGLGDTMAILNANIGNVYTDMYRHAHKHRRPGWKGRAGRHLEQAQRHLNTALRIYTRKRTPLDWARATHSLGDVHWNLYRHTKLVANLKDAIDLWKSVLPVFDRVSPEEFASVNYWLGTAYKELVVTADDATRFRLGSPTRYIRVTDSLASTLTLAVKHFRKAARHYRLVKNTKRFLDTCQYMGFCLRFLYLFRNDPEHLHEALRWYSRARPEIPPGNELLSTSFDLFSGLANWRLYRHTKQQSYLEAAAGDFRAAATRLKRKKKPIEWAQLQMLHASIHVALYPFDGKRKRVGMAMRLFRSALGILTRSRHPEH
jgi:tetratricopeptide (TPR) repeat protein